MHFHTGNFKEENEMEADRSAHDDRVDKLRFLSGKMSLHTSHECEVCHAWNTTDIS